eukprot:15444873-Alexandrium_andersonii.AAC.1
MRATPVDRLKRMVLNDSDRLKRFCMFRMADCGLRRVAALAGREQRFRLGVSCDVKIPACSGFRLG